MTCESCGEKPKKCNKDFTRTVVEIDNPEQITLMRKVTIPASMGDDTTVPPVVGKYKNVLLYYEANQKSYLYSSDGIPTLLANGLTDYEQAVNLPQINGVTLVGDKTATQLGLQDKLTAGANISIDSDNVISAVDTTYGPATDTEIGLVKPGAGLEVASDGTLSVDNVAFVFDTVADMKASTDLVDGSYAKTLGYFVIEDGGGAYYKIRTSQPSGFYETLNNGLYAELIVSNELNIKSIGCKSDGSSDISTILNNYITNYLSNEKIVFTRGTYLISNTISITKTCKIIGENGTIQLGGADFNAITIESTAPNTLIEGLSFTNPNNYTPSVISSGNIGDAIRIKANACTVDNCTIENYIAGVVYGVVGENDLTGCYIKNCKISIKGLNTGYINDGICLLESNGHAYNNIIKTYDSTISRAGIACDIHGDKSFLENNQIDCNGTIKAGIHCENSQYVTILNNSVKNPYLQGVLVTQYCVCRGNYIETPSAIVSGFSQHQCAISGYTAPKYGIIDSNTLVSKNEDMYGIYIHQNANNVKITNNTLVGERFEVGIGTRTSVDAIISNNTIDPICDTSSITAEGDRCIISNNQINGGGNYGLNFPEATNLIVDGNIVKYATTAIRLYNNTGSKIINNTIGDSTNLTTNGITIQNVGTHKYNVISGNDFINCTTVYNKVSYYSNTVINDKDQIMLYDTTNSAYKKLTIDNSTVVIS